MDFIDNTSDKSEEVKQSYLIIFTYEGVFIMKKILNINLNPYLRSYTHHGYLHAIASSAEKASDVVAKVEIKNHGLYEWNIVSESLTFHHENNMCLFTSNKFNLNMNCFFSRETVSSNDELEIIIHNQLLSYRDGAIGVFLSSHKFNETRNKYDMVCKVFNYMHRGIFVEYNDREKRIEQDNTIFPLKIRVKRIDYHYIIYVNDIIVESLDSKIVNTVGFEVKLGDSLYYDWLFMNHIQLCGNLSNSMPIDFYFNLPKTWSYYIDNALFHFHIEKEITLKIMNIKPLEYIKRSIDNKRYVEIFLNHKDIQADNFHDIFNFLHPVLIYGYDDFKNILYILAYDKGIVKKARISYECINNRKWKDIFEDEIRIIEYKPSGEVYHFNLKYVITELKSYLYGEDSYQKIANLVTKTDLVYGINIYSELVTEYGIKIILNDIRISHLLYEHKLCMLDRIEFFKLKGFITKKEYLELYSGMCGIVNQSLTLRNIILKNQLCNSTDITNRVVNIITSIRQKETSLYKALIEILDSYECIP